jgi:hypothetical protein
VGVAVPVPSGCAIAAIATGRLIGSSVVSKQKWRGPLIKGGTGRLWGGGYARNGTCFYRFPKLSSAKSPGPGVQGFLPKDFYPFASMNKRLYI